MKSKNIYLLTIIFSLFATGCSDDFLDRQPLDRIITSNFYQTEEHGQQALIAVYDAMQYQSSPGISWAPYMIMSDILSDDAFAGGGDRNDGADEDQFNKFNIPTSNLIAHSLWAKNYTGIYRANLYLEIINDLDATDEFKLRTSAEAKFMRAYFYFELVKFFENVPLLTATIKGPSEISQEQNTPAEVYNQIALDLVEAIDDLPEVLPAEGLGRISKWAAEALLARVYLFNYGVYGSDLIAGDVTVNKSTALGYVENIITSSGHALLDNYKDIFRLASEYSLENVFEIGYGDDPVWWDWNYVRGAEGNLSAQMQGPRAAGGSNLYNRGWSFGTVSNKLATDMASDPRLSSTILTEAEILADAGASVTQGYQHTGNYSKKYSSDAEHWGGGGQFELNRTCNFRVIRYSDVLLMAAELGSANALDYIKQVRDRAYFPAIDPAPVTSVTEDIIHNERRMEFALEGIRYFDVLRRGLTYAEQELTVAGQGDFDVTFNKATKGFLPIPQAEIDLSAGVFVQNAGY